MDIFEDLDLFLKLIVIVNYFRFEVEYARFFSVKLIQIPYFSYFSINFFVILK